MNSHPKIVACFGEILWDIFPGNNPRAGGAPFNVSYHLNKMGIHTEMISSVGNDNLGHELLAKIKNWNLSDQHIQLSDEHPTSTVIAHIDEHNEAHYDIVENVAWDNIMITENNLQLVKNADALVFGSLATRNETTRKTLFELAENSHFNVFDINLRAPFYDVSVIKDLLHLTQLAKFNKAELRLILEFLNKDYTDELDAAKFLQNQFGMKEIIISKGSKGALYVNEDQSYFYPAVTVDVKDTVGSGDSFLAGFLSRRLITNNVDEIMSQAVSLGAFITSKEGACPDYSLEEFNNFKASHI